MKYKWLNRNNNQKLIVFFNGWGIDENIVKHLDCEDYDVLMFYDYNTLDVDFNLIIGTRVRYLCRILVYTHVREKSLCSITT